MLHRFTNFIQNQKKKFDLIKQMKKIDQYLDTIEQHHHEMYEMIIALKKNSCVINDDQTNEIKNKFLLESSYLNRNEIFDLNDETRQVISQQLEAAVMLPQYQKSKGKYNKAQARLLQLSNELKRVQLEVNKAFETHSTLASSALQMIDKMKEKYIANADLSKWKSTYQDTYRFFRERNDSENSLLNAFLHLYEQVDQEVDGWNRLFVEKELTHHGRLLDKIDGKSLDGQQRLAVVTEQDSTLILAGAGSGKTLTISGKVKYLVDSQRAKPEEILLLSFTRKAAEEMQQRIGIRLGVPVDVYTFHKLGLSLIAKSQHKKPSINDELFEFLETYMMKMVYQNKKQLQRLLELIWTPCQGHFKKEGS